MSVRSLSKSIVSIGLDALSSSRFNPVYGEGDGRTWELHRRDFWLELATAQLVVAEILVGPELHKHYLYELHERWRWPPSLSLPDRFWQDAKSCFARSRVGLTNVKSLRITGTSAVCGSALTTLGFKAFFRLSNFGFPHSKSLKSRVRSGWPLSHR